MNKLHEICTSSSLEANLSNTKIMIFGHNKRKLNQEAFYVDKDRIEITHEYKYIGLISIHMVALSHQVKGEAWHV
jgi:hypothetical protein